MFFEIWRVLFSSYFETCCASFLVSIFGRLFVRFREHFGRLSGAQIGHFWRQFLDDFCMSFQERPKRGQERPKSDQERPKSGQERPKSVPSAAKSAPRAPQERHKSAQERPKTAQERPKTAPRAPKRAPTEAKRHPRVSQEASWRAQKRAQEQLNRKNSIFANFEPRAGPSMVLRGWASLGGTKN